jgi:opacity protein-like surface antigen
MHTFNSSKMTFSVLIAAAAIAAGATQAAAVDGVISSTSSAAVDYCHSKFPAIRPSTLGTQNPQLKQPSTGDVVDYYGPCTHDPRGKDEAADQEREDEMRHDRDYAG